jgi:uncharacterized membrane protein
MIKETHLRTTAKAVVYRTLSVSLAILLTLIYGASLQQALAFGVVALFIGMLWFYLYDRAWLFIKWNRNTQGQDTKTRSAVKAVLYRIAVIAMTAATARLIFTDSSFIAILMAGSQFITNILVYFVLERVWNKVAWGKLISQQQENTHGNNI